MKTHSPTRCCFLKSGLAGMLAAGVAPQFVGSRVLGAQAPSRKITLGFIGVGKHTYALNYTFANALRQRPSRDDWMRAS